MSDTDVREALLAMMDQLEDVLQNAKVALAAADAAPTEPSLLYPSELLTNIGLWVDEDGRYYRLASQSTIAARDAVPNEPTLEQLDDPYLLGGCTEGNCQLCRTPKSLRKVGMQHAGISAAPQNAAAQESKAGNPQAASAKVAPVAAAPMPPLPPHHRHFYTADQMHAYARAYAEQETAALRADLETYRRAWNDSDAKVASLRAELDAAKADAERYRWLRENALTVDMVADPDNLVQVWTGTDPAFGEVCFRGRTLDAVIDSARSRK